MKRIGLLLLLVLTLSIMPTAHAAVLETDYIFNTVNTIRKPTGETWITGEGYTIEYNTGKTWVQLDGYTGISSLTKTYQHYIVTYEKTDEGYKSTVYLTAPLEAEYRINWVVTGIKSERTEQAASSVTYYDGLDWIRVDWGDAKAVLNVADVKTNSITVSFYIGQLKQGETYTLDPVIADSYTGSLSTGYKLRNRHPSTNATISAVGQVFNATTDFNIGNVTLYLNKNGAPTANLYLYLYAVTGTYGVNATPTGAPLAISSPVNSSTIGGPAFNPHTWEFPPGQRYLCKQGTQYAIMLQAPALGDPGVFNDGNYVSVQVDDTAPTHSGNTVRYSSSAWTGVSGHDTVFIIYEYIHWNPYADTLDDLFTYWGIMDFMTQITAYVSGFASFFSTSLTRIVDLIVLQFTVITEVWGVFFYWSTAFINIFLDFSTFIHETVYNTGAWDNGLGNWLTIINWAELSEAVPIFALLWYISELPKRADRYGDSVIISDINTAISLFSYFFGIFSIVANTVIDRATGLLDAIL